LNIGKWCKQFRGFPGDRNEYTSQQLSFQYQLQS